MTDAQKAFLERVQFNIENDYETKLTDEELIFALPDLGLERRAVKTELIFFAEDCGVPDQESGILQVYITVGSYDPDLEEQLSVSLMELSQKCLLGHFGTYIPLHQVYYRYSVLLPDLEAVDAPMALWIALSKMSGNLGLLYDYVLAISNDKEAIGLDEYLHRFQNLQAAMEKYPDFLDKMEAGEFDE